MLGLILRKGTLSFICTAVLLAGFGSTAAFGDAVIFTDTTFNLSNYTQSPVYTKSR
jgi:hypothetical protein